MEQKKVGKRIRMYRKQAGMSQEQLSEIIDISVTSISNIERGLFYPTFENFIKIANALHVSADLLLCDVINGAYTAKATELSARLEKLPPVSQKQALLLLETLIHTLEQP